MVIGRVLVTDAQDAGSIEARTQKKALPGKKVSRIQGGSASLQTVYGRSLEKHKESVEKLWGPRLHYLPYQCIQTSYLSKGLNEDFL